MRRFSFCFTPWASSTDIVRELGRLKEEHSRLIALEYILLLAVLDNLREMHRLSVSHEDGVDCCCFSAQSLSDDVVALLDRLSHPSEAEKLAMPFLLASSSARVRNMGHVTTSPRSLTILRNSTTTFPMSSYCSLGTTCLRFFSVLVGTDSAALTRLSRLALIRPMMPLPTQNSLASVLSEAPASS